MDGQDQLSMRAFLLLVSSKIFKANLAGDAKCRHKQAAGERAAESSPPPTLLTVVQMCNPPPLPPARDTGGKRRRPERSTGRPCWGGGGGRIEHPCEADKLAGWLATESRKQWLDE